MITFNPNKNLTITANPKVVVKKEINVGGIKIPCNCEYDISNVPRQYHELMLQVISKI